MLISKKMNDAINKQIGIEFGASSRWRRTSPRKV